MRRKIRIFRAFDSEWNVIIVRARKAGYTNLSEYAREMLMNGEIKVFNLSEMQKLNLNLVRIGTNINQIAHACNELQGASYNKVSELMSEFEEIKKVVKEYVKPLEYTLAGSEIKEVENGDS